MKLVSVTLARDSAKTIGACLESARDLVDEMVVVDTGSRDETVEVAARSGATVISAPWPDSFAIARTNAFEIAYEAARSGADWGIMLDSDETLQQTRFIRPELARTSADVLLCQDAARTHWRERIFRLPLCCSFRGPTHEEVVTNNWARLDALTFKGAPKTREQLRRKLERDVQLLLPWVHAHSTEARWRYHLADSYAGLGDLHKAWSHFQNCGAASGDAKEVRAFACFRAGEMAFRQRNYHGAIDDCTEGLRIRCDIAECAWLAALAALRLRDWSHAIYWARTCEMIMREFSQSTRLGLRRTWGPRSGPDAILRSVYRHT